MKTALALTLSLVLALGLSACGQRPSGDDNSSSGRDYEWQKEGDKDSSQNKIQQSSSSSEEDSSEEDGDDSLSTESPAESGSALADWYNSSSRTALESTINNMFNDSGMTFSVDIEEPDVVIYNYLYTDMLNTSGMTMDDIAVLYEAQLTDGADDIISDIGAFQTTYGVSITIIRLNYINADGTLLYSADFTKDGYTSNTSSGSSTGSGSASGTASSGTYTSLQDWVESPEARVVIESTNRAFADSGMVMDLAADGDVFVYIYYVSDDLGMDQFSQEDLAAAFESIIAGQKSSLQSLFSSFESEYGLYVSAIRVSFYTEDGSRLLYSADIPNE